MVIVLELAVAILLLVGAGLLVRSFGNLRQLDLGFAPERVLALNVEPLVESEAGYRASYDAILERVTALPGVQAAGAVYLKPLEHASVGLETGFLLEGQSIERPDELKNNPLLNFQAVTPGYFETMRIAPQQGRLFSPLDTSTSPGVAIVSNSTARRLWPGVSAIGQRLSIASGRTTTGEFPWQTVVGVVGDVRYRGLDDVRLDVYMSHTQTRQRVEHLLIRTTSNPLAAVTAVRAAIGAVTSDVVVDHVTTLENVVADAFAPWRFSVTMFVLLAAIGVLLSAVGLFALVAYSVAQRSREIALRLALGAEVSRVRGMIVWQAGRLAIAGIAIGAGLSLLLAPLGSSLLFGVGPHDGWTLAAAAALLACVTGIASYAAARRVSAIEPLRALQSH